MPPPSQAGCVCPLVLCSLIEVGNYLPAGELFREIQQFKPAIDAFIKAEAWDRARDVARTAAPQYKCAAAYHALGCVGLFGWLAGCRCTAHAGISA